MKEADLRRFIWWMRVAPVVWTGNKNVALEKSPSRLPPSRRGRVVVNENIKEPRSSLPAGEDRGRGNFAAEAA
jgi:hypothetical protein